MSATSNQSPAAGNKKTATASNTTDTKIDSLDDDATAEVEQASNEPVAAVHKVGLSAAGKSLDDQMSGDRKKILMHASDSDGGSDAVPVSINGYTYQIPRGVICDVPVEVIEVLQNAVQTLYIGGAGGNNVERKVPRFAYNVL